MDFFQGKVGVTDFSQTLFNLTDLMHPVGGFESLEAEFTREEIDGIVAKLSNNKSPGPDGFTNEFIKGCWPLVSEDFYWLCRTFNSDEVCLRSINGSHITLIPKRMGLNLFLTIGPFPYSTPL